jgi:hypothetical protein
MTATLFKIPDEAKREMQKQNHTLSSLNGKSKEAEQYIVSKKFSNAIEIETALRDYSGNAVGAMAFNNENNYLGEAPLIKSELMLHMTPKASFDFLKAKDDVTKKEIIEKVISFLTALDSAESESEKTKQSKELAEKAVKSAQEILSKVRNADPGIEKKVLDAIKNLNTEISADQPSSAKLKSLTGILDTVAGELTDDTQITDARGKATEFILYTEKQLEASDLPPGTKEFFVPKLENLKELAKGKNPFAIEAEIENLGKELHQKTSKELLTKDICLDFIIASMVRMVVQSLFKITDQTTFTGVMQGLLSKHIKPQHTQYIAGLGRVAKSSTKKEEVYADICLHTFRLIVDELLKVLKGNKDLSITLEIPHEVPFNVVDKIFSDLQIVILELKPDQIDSDTHRYTASVKLLDETRTFIAKDFTDHANLDKSQIDILINGPAFEKALKSIPQYVSNIFMESIEPAEKKDAVS